jgi:hypothetical protein
VHLLIVTAVVRGFALTFMVVVIIRPDSQPLSKKVVFVAPLDRAEESTSAIPLRSMWAQPKRASVAG